MGFSGHVREVLPVRNLLDAYQSPVVVVEVDLASLRDGVEDSLDIHVGGHFGEVLAPTGEDVVVHVVGSLAGDPVVRGGIALLHDLPVEADAPAVVVVADDVGGSPGDERGGECGVLVDRLRDRSPVDGDVVGDLDRGDERQVNLPSVRHLLLGYHRAVRYGERYGVCLLRGRVVGCDDRGKDEDHQQQEYTDAHLTRLPS